MVVEPAVDIVRTATSSQFQGAAPAVHFLQSREGRVEEKPIKPADIVTSSQVCDENIDASADPIVNCISISAADLRSTGSAARSTTFFQVFSTFGMSPVRKARRASPFPLTRRSVSRRSLRSGGSS